MFAHATHPSADKPVQDGPANLQFALCYLPGVPWRLGVGVGDLPVDITFFCLADGMEDPAKFEGVAGGITFGEFGCPEKIKDIKFPAKRGHHSNQFDNDDDDNEEDD